MPSEPDRICGVERSIVEDFIILFRNSFTGTRKATYFLEQKEGIANVTALANIRDSLSHFSRAMDPDIPESERRDQLVAAEEHLRRATVEPYHQALNRRFLKFNDVYEQYRKKVIPRIEKDRRFTDAPNVTVIESVIARVDELSQKGRNAKALNFRDGDWQTGVTGLVDGYEELYELHIRVDSYLNMYNSDKSSRRQMWYTIWSFVATVWGLGLTLYVLFFN